MRAALAEDRRLKMIGLTLVVASGFAMTWISSRVGAEWPMAPARFAGVAVGTLVVVNVFAAGLLVLTAGCGKTRPAIAPQRRRAVLLVRIVLANVLAPALLFAVITSEPSIDAEFKAQGWDTALSLVLAVLVVLAWRLWRRSRQYGAIDAAEAMRLDPRPPVLYLRSFADDGAVLLGDPSRLAQRGAALIAPASPEQEMATILGAIGPVVAIGKPGEPLPELGAARLYVADDAWQAKVRELMRMARLVVLRIGASPGLIWEIEQALVLVPRQRLVFAMLGGSALAPELQQRLAPALGPSAAAALPEARPAGWALFVYRDPRRRIGGLVAFDADGRAFAVPVRRWPLQWRDIGYALLMRWQAGPLLRAWSAVFARLGLAAGVSRRSRGLAVTLALVFGWFGGHWFYLGRRRRGILYALGFPLMVPLFLGFVDAYRFLWFERAEFDARFSMSSSATDRQ
ncbi:MAG: TM2 domain-containing protein [Rhizobacter sp.]|nr:TM2 domain-containing protein [Rhizobacter sp.]